ncbi:ATP-dependent DNA helicase RecG [Tersicoccus phoenicis]|uniref:ATP-dependent DNA helicase RecG n=1 Tax=Tersicoccus phoenicis TaxID=554083 RepID=A0A1R1LLC0_9MICC|nr:ATP-dependent DNA helicase RecG [Tersicoccus phoenicis]OMH28345.1 ATP-dependent DNA helicase RecG [Tersicoccus phoenicis]
MPTVLDPRAHRLDKVLGRSAATKLEKSLHIRTVGALLNHFPRRYLERGELQSITGLPIGEEVTLIADVLSCSRRPMQRRKGYITEVLITDRDARRPGTLSLSFFQARQAYQDLQPGVTALFSGKTGLYRHQATLTNPHYLVLDGADEDAGTDLADRPIPVYPATSDLTSWWIGQRVEAVLKHLGIGADPENAVHLPDVVPAGIAAREHLGDLVAAYRDIHAPVRVADAYRARHRFRYQEALILQTALARRRAEQQAQVAVGRPRRDEGLLPDFDAALPFSLTDGQRDVGESLDAALSLDHPMNVLLQGEVGSGKTLVALRAMLQVVDAGAQAALLAPTEVLAAQHHASITATLGPLAQAGMLGGADHATRVVLLTGSMSTAARREALLAAASGEAGIVVGTHALLSETVQFAELGLVVVDEQHRFGVEQRDALRTRSGVPPHLLVMTATPIPRTVAMTVFGDLGVLSLEGLPAGRAPIDTHIVPLAERPVWRDRIWQRAREEVDAGRQVYVVCPKITGGDAGGTGSDDSDGTGFEDRETDGAGAAGDGAGGDSADDRSARPPLASVEETVALLQRTPALAGVRIGELHGRLDPADKTDVMAAFHRGDVDVLVSTTVIEVGVDVARATLMVILDADRFGISQLHQLRGRVGRGGLPGTCLLVTGLEDGHPSRARLDAVASTTDGFRLAAEDLKLRREGDILGARQSGGHSTLKLLRVIEDERIIAAARQDAQAIVEDDPDLTGHPVLAGAIDDYLDPEAEEYLDRG